MPAIKHDDVLLRLIRDLNDVRSALRRVVATLPLYDIDNENSPAQITANQNNYIPGNFDVMRLTSSAAYSITGISGGVKGRKLRIFNVGAHQITLAHESGLSIAANRIKSPTSSDIIINPGGEITLYYDSTQARWRSSYSSDANRISCQLRLTGAQSIGNADATYAKISWQTAVVDTGGFWNPVAPTLITIPETGWYEINSQIVWDVNGTNLREAMVRDETLGYAIVFDTRLAVTGAYTNTGMSRTIYLPKGEQLATRVWQNSGGALNVRVDRTGGYNVFTEMNVIKA